MVTFALAAPSSRAKEVMAMTPAMRTTRAAARSRTTRVRDTGVLKTISSRPSLSSADQRATWVMAKTESSARKIPNQM